MRAAAAGRPPTTIFHGDAFRAPCRPTSYISRPLTAFEADVEAAEATRVVSTTNMRGVLASSRSLARPILSCQVLSPLLWRLRQTSAASAATSGCFPSRWQQQTTTP